MQVCPTTKPRSTSGLILVLLLLGGAWGLDGCYYDVRDELYGQAVDCDTTAAVSFEEDLVPLLELNCTSPACHGGGSYPDLTTHTAVAQSATEGSLLDRIRKSSGDPGLMPKNGTPLPECDLQMFERWVNEGALDN